MLAAGQWMRSYDIGDRSAEDSRCNSYIQKHVHATAVDLVHRRLPLADSTLVVVENGEVKRLKPASASQQVGSEGVSIPSTGRICMAG